MLLIEQWKEVSVDSTVYLSAESFVSIVCGFGPRRHVEVAEWCVLDGSSGKEGVLSSRHNIALVDTCGLIACCQQQIIISSPMSKIPISRPHHQNV